MSPSSILQDWGHLFVPLICSNTLHMVVVKKNLFSKFKVPLSLKFFGPNKTWRGVFVVIFLNMLFFSMVTQNLSAPTLLTGALLGASYVLFELPNSFQKRLRKIPAGESGDSLWQLVMDKTDSAIGVCLTYSVLFSKSITFFFVTWILASMIHLSVSMLLVQLKVKRAL